MKDYKSTAQSQRYGYRQFTVDEWQWVASHPQLSIIWTDKKEREQEINHDFVHSGLGDLEKGKKFLLQE